jgi:hypothetical protein
MAKRLSRRKNTLRKSSRRKNTLRRKSLKRNSLRRKTMRRKNTLRRKSLRRKKSKRMKGGKDGPNCVDSVSALRRVTPHVFAIDYTLINSHTKSQRLATVYTLKIDYPHVSMRMKLTYTQITNLLDSYIKNNYEVPSNLDGFFNNLPYTAELMKTEFGGKFYIHNLENCTKKANRINNAIKKLKESLDVPGESLGDTLSEDDKIQCLEILGWNKEQVREKLIDWTKEQVKEKREG